ncbi:2,3-bisphosphoglycerate-independent phosphoglycerate mutase [Patescibacteria group bacterium]|nr:2,3-bisphosphoglycerate-independent phosphoglycerate mutase [Patescibacteria group bacterium]MBU0964150.1 2,3-bisphosphoglycerate-independent phosphoglycerate mutase [Patescibacteria group bacterium]
MPNKPVVIVILDGWGVAPSGSGNPISAAKAPNYKWLLDTFPAMTLQASGEAVGLPWGEMGNSEVGHLNLGAGRIVYQNLPRISKSISDGDFFTNQAFLQATEHVKKNKSALHLMGLASGGGVHSSLDHLFALMEVCKKQKISDMYLHLFLDGRDTPRDSGKAFIEKVIKKMKELKIGKIATISGRYYAMDRDNRWDREEKAYNALALGVAECYGDDPINIIEESYKKKNYDEEFIPTVIGKPGKPVATIKDKDSVIFFNFRPDRARQLTTAFVLPGFEKFKRPKYLQDLLFITMTEYDKDLPVNVAFAPEKIDYPIARVVSEAGLKQLHIAETEKYAHVTYFFNGGHEELYKGQDNVIIPSPSVASYDQKPEMSAIKLTDRMLKEIKANKYDFIVLNYANPDMVSHTGDIEATVKAIETVDECLGRLVKAVLQSDGLVFITADHGNAEELTNLQTGEMDKEHSINPVPFIAVANKWQGHTPYKDMIVDYDLSMLQPTGILSDIAVTALTYMGLKPSPDMTGHNLLT